MPGKDQHESPARRGARVSLAAGAALDQGDFDRARTLFTEALELFRQSGDEPGAAGALYSLGGIAWLRDEYETAGSLFAESLESFTRQGDATSVALTLRSLGLAYSAQAKYHEAQPLFEQSVEIYEDLPDPLQVAMSRECLGTLLEARGDTGEARLLLEECLEVYQQAGEQQHAADTLSTLVRWEVSEEDYWAAANLLREELEARIQIGDHAGCVVPLEWFAVLASTQNHQEEGARLLGAADTRRKRTETPRTREETEHIEDLVFGSEPVDSHLETARRSGRSLSDSQVLTAIDALLESLGELLPVGPPS